MLTTSLTLASTHWPSRPDIRQRSHADVPSKRGPKRQSFYFGYSPRVNDPELWVVTTAEAETRGDLRFEGGKRSSPILCHYDMAREHARLARMAVAMSFN